MPSSDDQKNLKSEAAKEKPRDEHGHFIKNALGTVKEVSEITHKASDDEKLVKVEVNDPLAKVYRLLEQLRQQKAFAFTLKGSLGIAGVAVALSVFGLFGGSKILCDKGVQTHIGTIRVLQTFALEESNIPFFGPVVDFIKGTLGTRATYNRVILEIEDTSTIQLPRSNNISASAYKNQLVYATGHYDSCSKVLKIESVESY